MCVLLTLYSFSQITIEPIRADVTGNAIVDLITHTDSSIIMILDNKKYNILFENLGFEHLSALSFKNNVLAIAGGNDGTGAYSWSYKFRRNVKTQKLELIGFDSFSKWVSGNITKSINLLTGQYEILLESYNHKKDAMDISKYTGKSAFKKVVLTEITAGSFDKLNEVGKQYTPQ